MFELASIYYFRLFAGDRYFSMNVNQTMVTLTNMINVRVECPLNNMCLTKDLVYQAEVKTKDNNDIKTYIGMTATTFKERYRNHKKSFNDIKYENETELSKHVWKLKLNREQFN